MPYQSARTPIGRRRERAIVYSRAMTDDGMGGQSSTVPASAKVAEIWVRPIPLDDRRLEAIMAGQLSAQRTYHFDTAYREDITAKMYLTWRRRELEIHTVADDDARKKRLVLFCSEVATSGT